MFTGTAGEKRTALAARIWDRRGHARFRQREAARRFNMDSIGVRITTTERRFGATLVDLSAEGAGVLVAEPLPPDAPVGVELPIGQYTVAALGQVITVMSQAGRYRLGLCFLHLDPAERELLRLLDAPAKRA